ncbi:hypothetical protein TrVE_jg5516 [Triparma verrucosa]|uniref:Uncharacterized protein n=1 Tax=Triparma verrucosa TaxID=1606542 RepID=A0A9W7EVE4_9STRA|nr:hypothetical protein TrVE_jg5516 [Triparma verrucosa]
MDITISEQFAPYQKVDLATNEKYITREDICKAINLPSLEFLDDLLERCKLEQTVNRFNFGAFVSFLETGTLPGRSKKKKKDGRRMLSTSASDPNLANLISRSSEDPLVSVSQPSSPRNSPPRTAPLRANSSQGARSDMGFPPTAPSSGNAAKEERRIVATGVECIYPSVHELLGFRQPVTCRSVAMPLPGGVRRRPGNGRPLWKKQETVIQERIVKYITIEPDGSIQELIESEKNQTEVTHMECKDTGEFAHKETTEYEQTETFNSELVMAERGTEKYVHLKSKDDEYEHLESHMPRKEREEAERMRMHEEHLRRQAEEAEMRERMAAGGGGEEGELEGMEGEGGEFPETPVGFRLGDPMPEGLTEDEQIWWHGRQRELLEEQYMKDLINANISEGHEGDGDDVVDDVVGDDGDGPVFYEDGMLSPEPKLANDDMAEEEGESLIEEVYQQEEEAAAAVALNMTTPPPVVKPGLKEGLFDPKTAEKEKEGAGEGAKGIFGELDDEENRAPVSVGAQGGEGGGKTPKKGARLNSPGGAVPFASPTPSDKECGLD